MAKRKTTEAQTTICDKKKYIEKPRYDRLV